MPTACVAWYSGCTGHHHSTRGERLRSYTPVCRLGLLLPPCPRLSALQQCLALSPFLLAFISLHLEMTWPDPESPLSHPQVCLLSLKPHSFPMICLVSSIWPGREQVSQMDSLDNRHHVWSTLMFSFFSYTCTLNF